MSKLFRNSLWVLLSLGIVSIMVNLISYLLIAPALVVPSVLIGGAYVAPRRTLRPRYQDARRRVRLGAPCHF